MKIRSALYTAAKVLGDIQAIRKHRVVQRIKNRLVWRTLAKLARKIT